MSASFSGLSGGDKRSKQQNAGSLPCFRFNELFFPVEKCHQTEVLKDGRPTSHLPHGPRVQGRLFLWLFVRVGGVIGVAVRG